MLHTISFGPSLCPDKQRPQECSRSQDNVRNGTLDNKHAMRVFAVKVPQNARMDKKEAHFAGASL